MAVDNSIEQYIRDISIYPRITAEREAELSRIISKGKRKKTVEKAVAEMVEANLRLVVHCLKNFTGYLKSPDVTLTIMDLIAEGNIALMNSARKFNVEYTDDAKKTSKAKKKYKTPIRFSSYACKSIKCAMRRAVRLSKFIHIPENHFGYWAKINALEKEHDQPITDKTVIKELEISESKLDKLKTSRQSRTAWLEDFACEDGASNWNEIIPDTKGLDPERTMEGEDLKKCLLGEMKHLPERTQKMIYSMFFSDKLPTLGDLSARFGVSKERCRQICARGLQLLKQQLEDKWTITGDLEAFGLVFQPIEATAATPINSFAEPTTFDYGSVSFNEASTSRLLEEAVA